MEPTWVTTGVAVFLAVMGSSGFWAWLMKRSSQNSAMMQLLLGLAHDRIIFLGMSYVDRGYITNDEYEDLMKYLYLPYSEFGGNGLAERVMDAVKDLPIQGKHKPTEVRIAGGEANDAERRDR